MAWEKTPAARRRFPGSGFPPFSRVFSHVFRCFPRRFAQEHSLPQDLAAGLSGKGAGRLTPRGRDQRPQLNGYESIDPRVEKYVAKKLKLKSEDISTQIIPRDRHAFFFSVLGIIASSIERFAVEIRHLQRTEILEVEEKFSSKQKGSSAMPHKRNPVLSENLTGLARYIRSAVIPSMENIVLWHERDISHSSVCLLYTSPSPRDATLSRMPSSA
mgnify:CR=1 FL=1